MSMRPKVCLICEKYQLIKSSVFNPFHEAMDRRFKPTRYFLSDGVPSDVGAIKNYNDYDAIIWFVRFRTLARIPTFSWGNFKGLRAMYDQDACINFYPITGTTRYMGHWPGVFKRHGFHVLITTGRDTGKLLRKEGVNAVWIPKGYDGTALYDKGESRKGLCHFGHKYPAREEMLRYVKARGVSVTHFSCLSSQLNDHLNLYEGCLICNMAPGRRGKFYIPKYSEVMIKNFEVPASGCVPFCDRIPELGELGFKDGETMVAYSDFNELCNKLEVYLKDSDKLKAMSIKGAKLCADRHTWDHRMQEFENLIIRGGRE